MSDEFNFETFKVYLAKIQVKQSVVSLALAHAEDWENFLKASYAEIKEYVYQILQIQNDFVVGQLWRKLHPGSTEDIKVHIGGYGGQVQAIKQVAVEKALPKFAKNVTQWQRACENVFDTYHVDDAVERAQKTLMFAMDGDIKQEILVNKANYATWPAIIEFLRRRFNQHVEQERMQASAFLQSEERRRQQPKTPMYRHLCTWESVISQYVAAQPVETRDANYAVINGGQELVAPLVESLANEAIRVAARAQRFPSIKAAFEWLFNQCQFEAALPADKDSLVGSFAGHTRQHSNRSRQTFNGYNICRRCGREGHFATDCYARKDVNGKAIQPRVDGSTQQQQQQQDQQQPSQQQQSRQGNGSSGHGNDDNRSYDYDQEGGQQESRQSKSTANTIKTGDIPVVYHSDFSTVPSYDVPTRFTGHVRVNTVRPPAPVKPVAANGSDEKTSTATKAYFNPVNGVMTIHATVGICTIQWESRDGVWAMPVEACPPLTQVPQQRTVDQDRVQCVQQQQQLQTARSNRPAQRARPLRSVSSDRAKQTEPADKHIPAPVARGVPRRTAAAVVSSERVYRARASSKASSAMAVQPLVRTGLGQPVKAAWQGDSNTSLKVVTKGLTNGQMGRALKFVKVAIEHSGRPQVAGFRPHVAALAG